jgi:hypothetical protein
MLVGGMREMRRTFYGWSEFAGAALKNLFGQADRPARTLETNLLACLAYVALLFENDLGFFGDEFLFAVGAGNVT